MAECQGSVAGNAEHADIRVLFVDDEACILVEYQEFLEFKGVPSLVESDPLRAIDTVLSCPMISVVVTDLRMSGLDGVGLISRLQQTLPPDRKVRFLVLTGDDEASARLNCTGIPVLHKPVDPVELLAAVVHALEHP